MVVLADGGRLLAAAAWAGGVPVRLEGDSLVVLTDIWGEVRLPRSMVRGIVFAQRSHPRDRERLEKTVRDAASAPAESTEADAVLLTNSDRVVGELTALSGGSLELSTAAGAVKLPLSRVEAVVLGNSRQPSLGLARDEGSRQRQRVVVGTSDGTVLNATRVIADEKTLSVELGENLQIRRRQRERHCFIAIAGRSVCLSFGPRAGQLSPRAVPVDRVAVSARPQRARRTASRCRPAVFERPRHAFGLADHVSGSTESTGDSTRWRRSTTRPTRKGA